MNGAFETVPAASLIVVADHERLLLRTISLHEISRSVLVSGAAIVALTACQTGEDPAAKD
ncbi:MAG: hypothetical protein H2060_07120 [Azoarcus sp.]|nr:hypothetical protein [Azoarcus sp.]